MPVVNDEEWLEIHKRYLKTWLETPTYSEWFNFRPRLKYSADPIHREETLKTINCRIQKAKMRDTARSKHLKEYVDNQEYKIVKVRIVKFVEDI